MNDYIDDTADSGTRVHLEDHVNHCPNCWVVFDTTKKTIQVFKGMEPQPLSDDLQGRLMAALSKRMERGGLPPTAS